MSLLRMGFAGTVIILIIIIIRSLAIYRLPKRAFVVFWNLVLLRLLFPVYFPTQISELIPAKFPVPTFAENVAGIDSNIEMVDVSSLGNAVDIVKRDADAFILRHLRLPLSDPFIIQFHFLDKIWIAGSVLIAVFFLYAYLRWKRKLKKSIPVRNVFADKWIAEHKFKRTLEIRYSDMITSPLSYGIIKPVILMPKATDWTDEENLKYVLEHEYVHIRHFDAVLKIVLIVAGCVHWFNPFVWIMYVLANRDIELVCDEAVIHRFGNNTRKSYAMMLIKMEEARNSFAPIANNFNKNAIGTRIDAIIKMKRVSKHLLIYVCLIIFCIVSMLSMPVKANESISSDEYFVFHLSDINSDYVQKRLKADGVDTDSDQYKFAVEVMTNALEGLSEEEREAVTINNIGIKNLMQNYE